jgi:hypothetical protein
MMDSEMVSRYRGIFICILLVLQLGGCIFEDHDRWHRDHPDHHDHADLDVRVH